MNSVAKPTGAAIYERARRLANVAIWSVELQRRRLSAAEPGDADFVLRKWADFDFLIVALTRLRRAARLAAQVPELESFLRAAIEEFDSTLPGLKRFRNVAEHVDDYAIDRGREQSVCRQSLEVSSFDAEGPTLHWLGLSLNARQALEASEHLFAAIKDGSHRVKPPIAATGTADTD
jgi:hypothetical protein